MRGPRKWPKQIDIAGKRWKIVQRMIPRKDGAWAYTHFDLRVIQIDPRTPDCELSRVVLDEIIHAVAGPVLDNDSVDLMARSGAAALRKFGCG